MDPVEEEEQIDIVLEMPVLHEKPDGDQGGAALPHTPETSPASPSTPPKILVSQSACDSSHPLGRSLSWRRTASDTQLSRALSDLRLSIVLDGEHVVDPEIRPPGRRRSSAVSHTPRSGVDESVGRRVYLNSTERNRQQLFINNKIFTTKYTWWNFVPKNLFEQFMRIANFYFLMIIILQNLPGISPTNPIASIVPLAFVLSMTAIREAIEDWKRHKSDDDLNNRTAEVLRDGMLLKVKWKDVQVGDIVRVENESFFPADLVLLSSSDPDAIAYIETANLDGETNLKIRQALPETKELTTRNGLSKLDGLLECEEPSNRLYQFDGYFLLQGTKHSLGVKQLLLRGSVLRNTDFIFGLVVFTGFDTRVMRNATDPPHKRSRIEWQMNKNVILVFLLQCCFCLFFAIASGIWQNVKGEDSWYVALDEDVAVQSIKNYPTYVILINTMIPISLYVTVELVKVGQVLFINFDLEMYDEKSDTPAHARTSNLNEELGQIEYIFSDKTGTLTENQMNFIKFSCDGVSYGSLDPPPDSGTTNSNAEGTRFHDQRVHEHLATGDEHSHHLRECLRLLAVCHTVIPERDKKTPGQIIYQAASPDEGALVSGSKALGFEFKARTPNSITVLEDGKPRTYELLNVLEFTSSRKRMSVIVRNPEGVIKVYCKGADSVIYERLATGHPVNERIMEPTTNHLEEFATDGLRTLVLAFADLDGHTWHEWNQVYQEALVSIVDRDKKLANAAEMIEKNLILLGATAIEDKLQDGVPETIHSLAMAQIKIWVLTGDKQETAINIGFSCALLRQEMTLLIVNTKTLKATLTRLQNLEEENRKRPAEEQLGLIIDGQSLTFALEDTTASRHFLAVAEACKSVICCRVSPLQKALIVKLVKDHKNAVTLAIGDGANDVSMIQAAHVGIGISGKEGMQAVLASDYSIAQFRFLRRLLLVHGRMSYARLVIVIFYSFYKNFAFTLNQAWFSFFTGFTGQTLFDSGFIAVFNVLFTSLPIFLYGFMEQDIKAETALRYPQLYLIGQRNELFTRKKFITWLGNGIWHSLCIFFVSYFTFRLATTNDNGELTGLWDLGTIVYTCLVLVVNIKMALITRYWTGWTHFAIFGSMILWFLLLLPYCLFPEGLPHMYYVIYNLLRLGPFYFTVIMAISYALLPDFCALVWYRTQRPSRIDILGEQEYLDRREDKRKRSTSGRMRALTTLFQRRGKRSKEADIEMKSMGPKRPTYRGFAFDEAETHPSAQPSARSEVDAGDTSDLDVIPLGNE